MLKRMNDLKLYTNLTKIHIIVTQQKRHIIARFLLEQYLEYSNLKQFPVQFATKYFYWIDIHAKVFFIIETTNITERDNYKC